MSTTIPVADAFHGYMVKTGDATQLFVGRVQCDWVAGSRVFATTGTGWMNATLIPGTQTGVPAYLWADGTGKLRRKSTAPTSDLDGTVVGTDT